MNFLAPGPSHYRSPARAWCTLLLAWVTLGMFFSSKTIGSPLVTLAKPQKFHLDLQRLDSGAGAWTPGPDTEPAPAWTKPSCDLYKARDLNFGGIFTSPAVGTVTVSPASSASYSGGVYPQPEGSFHVAAAIIDLTLYNQRHREQDDHCSNDDNECDRSEDDDTHQNDCRASFNRHGCNTSISISSPATLRRSSGTETMTVDNFTISRTKGYVDIGATLHVGANQRSGSYTGTFTVTTVCE